MTHVHYKFSSKLSYDTVVFDGPHITLGELKKQIMCREKLRAGDCDLQITNAQTKEEYTDDDGPIPKGSSVIVRRIPTRGGKSSSKTSSKTTNIERSVSQSHHSFDVAKAMDDHSSPTTLHFFSKMANLAEADVSEEDKIKVMLNQSIYDSMNFNKKFGSVLPANYTCYRCGNTGHHIRNCPSSGQDKNFEPLPKIKKSTGIPRSFMVEVDDPNTKGAMLTNCGRYAIPAIDAEAYAVGKKERPPFVPQEKPKSEAEEDPVPDELLCLICHELLSDAVVIPCCGNSYCDDCIRTTLLDSEEHTCPTCGQQNVSPDTLIANKFLRQAVNNFKKERGYSKSKTQICDSSQSQNPTPAPSPVSTPPPPPPPLTVQSQPQKQHQSSYNQQAADTQPSFGNPPVAAVGPTSACLTSVQTEQSRLDIPDKEAKEEAQDDSAAVEEDTAASADAAIAVPPAVASDHDPTAAPSQLTPLANDTTVAEQPQSDHQKSSSGPAPGTSTCWGSSSSGCHTGGWTESQQLTSSPSSTYSAIAPPLFPSPLYHPYLTAHHSHSSYPPGYPPTPPIWTLPCPQGAPIPSLCSSTPTPSIPALIPEEWHRYQRKNKERSPDRGSSYRHSSSRSYSTSSKSKSSHTYSRSSSRSRSRSRSKSKGRSRPRSPYSHHRALHTHSHRSYSYGYKRLRSPTPSSSSSPQVGHHSRATSPSDHRKNRHHSHHHSRKSASSGYSSTRRGVRSKREEGQNAGSPSSSRFNQSSSMDLDRERHQQWNKQYSEWCEKYFSSYINHFHQLPLSFINLPPPPQFEGSKYYSHAKSDSCCRPSALMDDRSPPSKSSTDSRSPPSHSSSSSRSTPSHSSSDSCSSPSNTSNNSLSPPSQLLEYQRHKSGRSSFKRGSEEEEELQGKSKNSKQAMTGNLGNHSSKDSEQRAMKKDGDEGRREEPSSLHAPNPADDNQKVETGPITGPHSVSVRDEAIFQPLKSLDDSCHRKRKEKSDLVDEKRCIRDKDSKSRHDMVRQYKAKSNKAGDDTEYRNHGSSKAPDLSSMGDRKTKGETQEKRVHSEGTPPNPFEIARQKSEPKKESKTWPFRERGIWEGRITVKPPKKISININLDGKRKEGQIEDQKNITGEPKGEMEEVGEGRNLNKEETFEVHEMMKSTRHGEGVFEHKIKPGEGDLKEYKERAVIGDDASPRVMWTNTGGEEGKNVENKQDGDDEGIEIWPFVLRGDQEDKESKNLTGEGGRMKESKEEELARDERMSLTGKEEEGAVREENKGPEMGGLVQNSDEWSEAANGGNLPGEWTSEEVKTDGGKRRMKEDESQRSSNNRPSSNVESDSSSSTGDCQERTVDKAAESEDQRVLIQEESEEDEQNEGDVKPQDPFPVGPSPPNMETEGESEVKRQRSVDTTRDESRPMQKEGEKEKHFILSTLDRHVAPSSGKITTDSTLYSNRERERRIEMERCRDRERGRDSERSGDRHREKRSTKEEDRGRERRPQKKTHPSSSHSSPYSTSQDMERRDRQRRDDHRKSPAGKHSGSGSSEKISTGGATKVPDRHKASAYRDKSLDRKPKDKNPHHDYRDHRDAPGNRPAGSRHSSPSLPHCKQRDPLKSSPDLKSALKRSRDENKEEKEEWKRDKVNEVIRGSHSKSTAEKWEGVAVEEGERPSSSFFSFSSSSSPAGQESSKEDRRKERKRREKKEAAVELPEERELKKHGHTKKSKRGKDGREAESGGDVDNRWKEEDDHTELCSVMLF